MTTEHLGHPPLLVTVADAARTLSLSRAKTYELVLQGRLESILIDRCRRIPSGAIERFIESCRADG